jgi:hypothetical protein
MTEHDERLAALKATIDQAVEATVEMARAIGAYHRALISEGLDPDHALALCIAWQSSVLTQSSVTSAE